LEKPKGQGSWRPAVDGQFRGKYRSEKLRLRTFVIVYMFEIEGNRSGHVESVCAVPKEWISRDFRYVATPEDSFFWPNSREATTDNPKYDWLVNDEFVEYPVSFYPQRYGCK
jgi:hypothetical protein